MLRNLPEDLLISILLRLPIKNLVQCTTLSKSWYHLIKSPFFISLHLFFQQTSKKSNLYILNCTKNTQELVQFRLYHDDHTDNLSMIAEVHFPSNVDVKSPCFNVVGSVNGLICLRSGTMKFPRIFLWNPLIRRAVEIQGLVIPYVPRSDNRRRATFQTEGFGFDPVTNDYKVVLIEYYEEFLQTGHDQIRSRPDMLVWVYRFSTKSWKDIGRTNAVPYKIMRAAGRPAYLKNACHWIGVDDGDPRNERQVMVLFDMGKDVFREMPLPKGLLDHRNIRVFGLEGSVCLVHFEGPLDSAHRWQNMSVWRMREYGVEESWSLQHVLLKDWIGQCLLGLRNGGQFLYRVILEGLVISDDPKTGKRQDVGSDFGSTGILFVGTFVESLVLLDCSGI